MAHRGTPGANGVGGEDIATGKTDRLIASGQIEGMPVYSRAGEHLGSVHTLMIDTRTGQVTCAVMSLGGFLGIGERYHPLPWRKLECDARLGRILVDIDRAQLEGAPHYGRDETPWTNPSFDRDVYGYYGTPYYDV
jgi:sporulation protein YlmC with PRC-barrel domain